MGGPFSKNFPERRAAQLLAEGVLRLDPDGSVWRIRKFSYDGVTSHPVTPKRIDYGPPGGHRYFEILLGPKRYSKVQVARFIWQVHKGDIPPKLTVNHKDGRPDNNTIDNYELATHSEQHLHRFRVLGHTAPSAVNRKLAVGLAEAARIALGTGDLEPLRAALKAFDERPYGRMARYKQGAIDRRSQTQHS